MDDCFQLGVINELKSKLNNEKFINKSRLLLNSFTRERQLPFEALVLFLLQKSTSSLSVCLTSFFSKLNIIPPTKSALSQARASLCYKVYKRLNMQVCKSFYDRENYEHWKGFRILSVDGSTISLPDHPSLGEKFSRHGFGEKRNVEHWMSRVSFLYDVLNNIIIDAQMESFDTSEASLCEDHLGYLRKGDLVVFDRYYASHYLFSVLQYKNVHFLFRMTTSWKCVQEFVASSLTEQVVDVTPYKYSTVAKSIPKGVNSTSRIRLIKHVTRSGEVRVYATSLLDGQKYSQKSIINLYKKRWGVEEAYKTLKARLDVVHFSGKTIHAVQQDFYAKVCLITLTSVLKSDIKPALRTKKHSQNKENRVPIINNAFAMSQIKRLMKKLYFCFEEIEKWMRSILVLIKSKIEFSRKGQSNKRALYKGRYRKHSQNYKPV